MCSAPWPRNNTAMGLSLRRIWLDDGCKKQAGDSAPAAARNPPLVPIRLGYFRFVFQSIVAVSLATNAALHQFEPGPPGLMFVLNTPDAV